MAGYTLCVACYFFIQHYVVCLHLDNKVTGMKNIIIHLLIAMVISTSLYSQKTTVRDSTLHILKKVKVKFEEHKFWVSYDKVEDLILLSKNGFSILKTKNQIIRNEAPIVQEAMHLLVEETLRNTIQWSQSQIFRH